MVECEYGREGSESFGAGGGAVHACSIRERCQSREKRGCSGGEQIDVVTFCFPVLFWEALQNSNSEVNNTIILLYCVPAVETWLSLCPVT